ncbi:hypothetical protein [Cellulomonas massiliensis]|uniref:hypothetical protein n=1 Tax=Cellulomonas massiliensis TaxID=1465811 RepID=UPI00035E336D|nr:hypothetical protein [Cellulomonas massiliensis]
MSRRRLAAVTATLPLTALLLVAGCSGEPAGPFTSAPAAPSASATPTSTAAADEAAVRAAYDAFWDAIVTTRRGEPDQELLAGVATGQVVEDELKLAQYYADHDISIQGRPVVDDVVVSVDGATALVQACVDHDGWLPEGVQATPQPPRPTDVTLERSDDGTWRVSRFNDAEGTASC